MNRRDFLKCGAGALATAAAGCLSGRQVCEPDPCAAREGKLRIGVAGYTYNAMTLDKALEELEKLDVHWFCAKSFHYPFLDKISVTGLEQLVKKSADHGVKLYGAGPITTRTEDDARRAFEYCAVLGVPTLVGVPAENDDPKLSWAANRSSRKMCEICARLADEYRINFAIHNHGANPKTGNPNLYPTVVDTWKYISDLSPRIGFCVDIAYTNADGFDPSEILRTYAPRVFDIHFRNTAIAGNGSSGAAADAGVIDYVRIVRTLKEIGYTGVCGLELANAFSKPSAVNPRADPTWIPRSLGYFRGLVDAI